MYYTKCKLEKGTNKFSSGGSGEFREEWIPTHYAVTGNLLMIDNDIPWIVVEVGNSVTITKYMERLGEDVLERFKSKPWYEALKQKHHVANNKRLYNILRNLSSSFCYTLWWHVSCYN
jgi:hypothetical protein